MDTENEPKVEVFKRVDKKGLDNVRAMTSFLLGCDVNDYIVRANGVLIEVNPDLFITIKEVEAAMKKGKQ